MSKTTKNWLIAAAFLVVIGAVIIVAVMTAYRWDFSRVSTDQYETNTYEINEEFSDIKLNTDTADILFDVSDDNTCRVVCYEENKMKHSVSVQDGTLTISAVDDREWYEHIGFSVHSPKVSVYLPKTEYASIIIKASTGDIEIPNEIKVDSAVISLSTGDIRVNNMSVGTLDLSSSTGEIIVSNVTCTGDMKVSTTTGDVNVKNVTCQNLLSTGSTSDISLKNVIATGKLSVERSTGDVVFDSSDSAEIFVKTSTGDVTGSLLTEKVFVAKTSTGNISVPKTTAGEKCEIITSTGNIMFQ